MNCPICNGSIHENIYRLCDNMKILGKSFPEEAAYIVSCNRCGLVYMDTPATQDDFLSYYKYGANAPKYYEMFGKEETEQYYKHILEVIKPYISTESKLLDVAGAWGELAKYISVNGYQGITVVDSNEACIRSAEEKGLPAKLCSSLDMSSVLTEQYDMILLNHTLEHIFDVATTMENVQRLLKQNGYLFIEIPNAVAYLDEDSAPFNFLTYEHVLHLTANDLCNLAGLYGFEIVEMDEYYKKVSSYPSIYAVLKKGAPIKQAVYSEDGKINIKRYIEKSGQIISQILAPLRLSGEPLVLWGIGASTAILLELFSGCNVISLIDSNPARQGLAFSIGGIKHVIESPVSAKSGTIVILSIPYYTSIEKQIRSMGLNNKIISLA